MPKGKRTIGERIALLREFRDVTQEQLAERAGVSVDTIRKLEQGQRQTAYISTLRKLASALDVELERLLGQPTVTPELPAAEGGLVALRDAIQDVGDLPGVPVDGAESAPPAADEWVRAARDATGLYWTGQYAALAARLPAVLREGRLVAEHAGGREVWRELGLAYQVAASLATQTGHTAWAFQAVERQLRAAERASDPLLSGMGVSTLSWVLLRQGRWEEAQRVAERKADMLEPRSYRRARPAELAVYGNLLVSAATPAARRDRHDEASELLNAAASAAVRSGSVTVYGTAFSPVDVATQHVNVALAGKDGMSPARALAMADEVDLDAISRPVHRAAHRLDVSQAQYLTGDTDGALATLLEVEADQPQWIRFQTLATMAVQGLLEAERRRNTTLRGLAARLGIDPSL
ncbi:helix-turn-helix domain-containing protein [Streptomyces hoynatensis]|uniref:XRE family transcriptional regulator n=1 Tax=Streptomyces hoynatensis TaxID=1141874 RepID=A0A3A9YVV5_9ACTN|nr:helix-turn-helix transcriptional regulator [Streptomyces hoynatensis]RKN40125.1 XRE family transcriptional regulator [Streptomyces hoynatensis]